MAEVKITQSKSYIGANDKQRQTLRTLGLGRIGTTTVRADGPQLQGMIQAVAHLVTVEEVE